MSKTNNTQFLNNMGIKQLMSMFDLFPNTMFWIKDKNHKFIHVNQAFIDNRKLKKAEEIVGKTDFDLFPIHLARQFFRDDNKVLAGQQVTERLEINISQTGDKAWYSTSKRPIINEYDEIIGSYGITQQLEKQAVALSGIEVLTVPVDYIREHYHENFTIDELAQVSHLSVSALERRFKNHLKKSPKQFINEVRLENAQKLLVETNMPIAQVGYESGFPNPSYFTQQFRVFFDELPSDFRKNYQIL
ncbi:AraC family transcriptional regulator [Colwellia piezophila]|uniref:AraC family transcriptional regulator n=1 Tax=Colwellia piezophila TaxID=211668 RepID=UPI000476E2E9|nr:AraC family transcriptional regulator [Colwellia piezophila]